MPEQKATLAILFDREPPPEPPTGRRGRIASQRMARINNDANDEYDRYVRQVVDAAPPLTASDASRGSERVAGLATVDEGSPVGRIGSVPC